MLFRSHAQNGSQSGSDTRRPPQRKEKAEEVGTRDSGARQEVTPTFALHESKGHDVSEYETEQDRHHSEDDFDGALVVTKHMTQSTKDVARSEKDTRESSDERQRSNDRPPPRRPTTVTTQYATHECEVTRKERQDTGG